MQLQNAAQAKTRHIFPCQLKEDFEALFKQARNLFIF